MIVPVSVAAPNCATALAPSVTEFVSVTVCPVAADKMLVLSALNVMALFRSAVTSTRSLPPSSATAPVPSASTMPPVSCAAAIVPPEIVVPPV